MPRDVDDIVDASHDKDITILIKTSAVARHIIARPFRDIFQITFVILPKCGQASRGKGKLDYHGTFLAVGKLVSVGIENLHVIAGDRLRR